MLLQKCIVLLGTLLCFRKLVLQNECLIFHYRPVHQRFFLQAEVGQLLLARSAIFILIRGAPSEWTSRL